MKIIQEQVDIYEMPSIDFIPTDTELTSGDLHASIIKDFFSSIRHGAASNITADQYKRLVHIFQKEADDLSLVDLFLFNEIAGYLIYRNDIFLRKIGDYTADRVGNDIYMIIQFENLERYRVPREFLLSNHGIEFLNSYLLGIPFSQTKLPLPYTHSAHQLQKLIDKNFISRKYIESILDTAYLPYLKVASYSYGENKQFFIYSHARIGLKQIKDLAIEYNCLFSGDNVFIISKKIDCINAKFQKHLKSKAARQIDIYKFLNIGKSAIDFFLFNRDGAGLDRPSMLEDYQLIFVHGHDSLDENLAHVINLDQSSLAKAPHLNQGKYLALLTPHLTAVVEPSEDAESYCTGRKILSIEKNGNVENSQTSAAERLSLSPFFLFSLQNWVKKSPSYSHLITSSRDSTIPLCRSIQRNLSFPILVPIGTLTANAATFFTNCARLESDKNQPFENSQLFTPINNNLFLMISLLSFSALMVLSLMYYVCSLCADPKEDIVEQRGKQTKSLNRSY